LSADAGEGQTGDRRRKGGEGGFSLRRAYDWRLSGAGSVFRTVSQAFCVRWNRVVDGQSQDSAGPYCIQPPMQEGAQGEYVESVLLAHRPLDLGSMCKLVAESAKEALEQIHEPPLLT
jgi:hypothetical protein